VRSLLHPVPRLRPMRRRAPESLLLGIPRISPERELAVIRALLKPQLRTALENQIENGEQKWPRDGARRLLAAAQIARSRLGLDADFHAPANGEFFAVASVSPANQPSALAAALLLSRFFPGTWIIVGRLYVRDGGFFRRQRGVKLRLRPATNIHLSRPLRATLNEILRAHNLSSTNRRAQRRRRGLE
jgi:hypothetical protein